jgi:enoyl-CoA hydratase
MGSVLHELTADGIATIRFRNPPTGLLDGAMTAALEKLIDRLADDPAVKAIILTGGQPDVFIRHFDLGELAAAADLLGEAGGDLEAEWHSSPFHRITRRLETAPKIVIAAIDGVCMGVGLEVALACDIRIAGAGRYPIGLPEMNIAMFPGGGGTVRLARLLGPARAMELICTAATVTPEEAAALGLVNRVAPDALAASLALARRIVRLSGSGIAAAKRIIRASVDLDIEAALTLEQREVNRRLGSAEVRGLLERMVREDLDLRDPVGPEATRS